MLATTLHGRTTFEWHDGGAFLCVRSEIDEPGIPSGIAFIGSDDQAGTFTMLYFDERGVSRRYEVAMDGGVMRLVAGRAGLPAALHGDGVRRRRHAARRGRAGEGRWCVGTGPRAHVHASEVT